MCGVALRATACENEALTVNCYEQDVIRVINAHYGHRENDICQNNIGTINTECLVTGTRDVVYDRSVTASLNLKGRGTKIFSGPNLSLHVLSPPTPFPCPPLAFFPSEVGPLNTTPPINTPIGV